MTIAAIRQSIDVKAPPERAFDWFTRRMGDWWPKGRTPAEHPHEAVIVEPRQGGRWLERDAAGRETRWGTVLAWEPPLRLVIGWQLDRNFVFDPALVTEVEITFEALPEGGTRVRLEHRDLERFGADAATMAEKVGRGWPARLDDFARFADAPAAATAAVGD